MTRKLALIVVVTVAALAPAPAPAYLPPGFIGVAPQHGGNQKDYRLMREAGVTSVRLPLNWAGVQAESPQLVEPNWTGFDRDVELAAEQGIGIFPVVLGSPEWVAPEWRILPVRSAWQRWAWANFMRGAVHRFGPGGAFWREHPDLPYLPIRMWEIWNEENIVTFSKDTDPASYATLLRIAGRILHREDRGAKVLVGGLFGRPLQIPPNVGSGSFLAGLYEAGNVKRFFDGVALHPYVADVKAMGGQLRTLRRIMRRNGDARKSLYVTELGWGSRSGPTRWERGLYGQANQLSRAFSMLSGKRRHWRLGGAWWYSWTDEGGNCLFCGSAGLLTENREAKPSWYRFNAWTGGDPEIVPRAPIGD
jgi:hypothetical protein